MCSNCNSCNCNRRIKTPNPAIVELTNLELRQEAGSDITVSPTTEGPRFVWTIGGGLKLANTLGTSATKAISQNAVNAAIEALTDLANSKATPTDVAAAIAALVNAAPTTLDTLKELGDALGNDPNFATTMAAQIGLKANLADMVTALAGKLNVTQFPAFDIDLNVLTVNGFYTLFNKISLAGLHYPDMDVDRFAGVLIVSGDTNQSPAITQILIRANDPVQAWVRTKNHSGIPEDAPYWEEWTPLTNNIAEPYTPLVIGATTTWATKGKAINKKTLALTQNTALAITNPANGSSGDLILTQDATGGRTFALNSGSLPATIAINTVANGVTKLHWENDGTRTYWTATIL